MLQTKNLLRVYRPIVIRVWTCCISHTYWGIEVFTDYDALICRWRRRCAPHSAFDMNECLVRLEFYFVSFFFCNFCSKCVRTAGSPVPSTTQWRVPMHIQQISKKLIRINWSIASEFRWKRYGSANRDNVHLPYLCRTRAFSPPFQFHSTRWLTGWWIGVLLGCVIEFLVTKCLCAISISIVCPRPMNLPRQSREI